RNSASDRGACRRRARVTNGERALHRARRRRACPRGRLPLAGARRGPGVGRAERPGPLTGGRPRLRHPAALPELGGRARRLPRGPRPPPSAREGRPVPRCVRAPPPRHAPLRRRERLGRRREGRQPAPRRPGERRAQAPGARGGGRRAGRRVRRRPRPGEGPLPAAVAARALRARAGAGRGGGRGGGEAVGRAGRAGAARALLPPEPLWLTARRPEAEEALTAQGCEVRPGPDLPRPPDVTGAAWPRSLSVRSPVPLADLGAFRAGLVQPQNPSSLYAAKLLGAGPGELVYDLAAGPGVKTATLAAAGARVVAFEVSEKPA